MSKIAPHSDGLLAERHVHPFEFFEGHCFDCISRLWDSGHDFDGADLGIGDHRHQLDVDLAAGHRDREWLVDGAIRTSRCRLGIEARQQSLPVHDNVEDPLSGGTGEKDLGKLQIQSVSPVGHGKLVPQGPRAPALSLIENRCAGVGDGTARRVRGAAEKACVGAPEVACCRIRIGRPACVHTDRCEAGLLGDFDSADLGIGYHRDQLDIDLAVGDSDGKRFVDGAIRSACCRHWIETGQQSLPVHNDVEHPLSDPCEVDLGKLQIQCISAVGHGELIPHGSRVPALRLVQGLCAGVSDQTARRKSGTADKASVRAPHGSCCRICIRRTACVHADRREANNRRRVQRDSSGAASGGVCHAGGRYHRRLHIGDAAGRGIKSSG